MSETESERRRETLRTHMILTSVAATAAFAGVIATSLFVPIVTHFESGNFGPDELAGLADHILFLHSGFWPVVAVSLVASIVSALVLFQRMSSPLVRMVRVMQSVEGGHAPKPVVIRSTDYLQGEAQALNAMTEALRIRWAGLRESEARLRDAIEELAEREAELPGSLRAPLDGLRKSGAELRARVEELS